MTIVPPQWKLLTLIGGAIRGWGLARGSKVYQLQLSLLPNPCSGIPSCLTSGPNAIPSAPLSVLLFCVPTGPAQVVCSCLKEAALSQSLTLTVSPPSVPQCSWADRGDKDVLFRAEQSMVTYSQHLDLLHVPALTLFHCRRWFNCTSNYQSFNSRFTLQPMTSLAFLQSLYHQAWIPSGEADLKFIQKWLIAPEYSHTSGHEFLGR